MSLPVTRKTSAMLAAVGALLIAAFAAAPQAQASTIYACVKKNGTLRIVTSKTKCKKGETKQSWGATGPAGKNGTNGSNGTNGTNGSNGTNGTNGSNGAVGGFSATHTGTGVTFTTATEGSPAVVVTRTLPAGNYIVNGKVEALLADTKTGGFASVECRLIDTPIGGGTSASDTSTWASLINVPFIFIDLAQNTLPLDIAVNSPAHTSTIAIECWTGISEANGGTLTAEASNAAIVAVQTTVNS
jgi:hypothetical protein